MNRHINRLDKATLYAKKQPVCFVRKSGAHYKDSITGKAININNYSVVIINDLPRPKGKRNNYQSFIPEDKLKDK